MNIDISSAFKQMEFTILKIPAAVNQGDKRVRQKM